MNPASALKTLQDGNQRFVSGTPVPWQADAKTRERYLHKQSPFAVIITCSDSRVGPEIVFDQTIGDLFVVRIAGTLLTPEVIGSVEFAIEQLKSSLIVIMAHSNCGAIQAAAAGFHATGALSAVLNRLKPIVEWAKDNGHQGDELISQVSKENTRGLAQALPDQSMAIAEAVRLKQVELHKAYYDMESGKVIWDYI